MPKIYKVEVLGNDVQKYSSTSVSGGGGYVTTANGATFGQTEEITSTVNHHVDQEIWVKDLASGKEMQLNLLEDNFPVRVGHILTIAADESSGDWERLINESTGAKSNADGFFNQETVDLYYKEYKYSILWAIGLAIPIINLLVGLLVLKLIFVGTPSKIKGEVIPDGNNNMLISLISGCALFALSWTVLVSSSGFFITAISVIALFFSFVVFKKSCGANFLEASRLISKRAELLDKEVAEYRAKYS